MSYRKEKILTFQVSALAASAGFMHGKSEEDIRPLFLEVMHDAMHGICFTSYENDQKPGDTISEQQIRRRMEILKPYIQWIRTFSCTDGNQLIPKIAKEYGIKTLVGSWLGSDTNKNQEEISGLINLAKEGYVDIAAVGNEVLYRKDLTEEELLNYIYHVKNALPDIPIGYVDAYYEFVDRPILVEVSDIILCNCYPFWEGTAFEHSLEHMRTMYNDVVKVAQGKKVIITETGWPNKGQHLENAFPSRLNAMRHFINTQLWALDEQVEVFYFSSFDEKWKTAAEGDVGAFWGLWNYNEQLKY